MFLRNVGSHKPHGVTSQKTPYFKGMSVGEKMIKPISTNSHHEMD
jgi:hypothetical protein